MNPDDPTPLDREAAMEQAANFLMEWFDSVQLFAQADQGDKIGVYQTPRGNFYAMRRQIDEWCMAADEAVGKPEDDSEDSEAEGLG